MMFIRTDVSLENGDVPIFSHTVQCAHNRDRIGHTDQGGANGRTDVQQASGVSHLVKISSSPLLSPPHWSIGVKSIKR